MSHSHNSGQQEKQQTYEAPVLVEYGKVAELTRHGHVTTRNDNVNGTGNTFS